jgi:hypothetical protein
MYFLNRLICSTGLKKLCFLNRLLRFKKCKFLASKGENQKEIWKGEILKEFFAGSKDPFTLLTTSYI